MATAIFFAIVAGSLAAGVFSGAWSIVFVVMTAPRSFPAFYRLFLAHN
jgi:hypothetical protein